MVYVTARIDFQLALVALAITPPLLMAAIHYRPRMRNQAREVKRLESGALSVIQEVLTGLRLVKSFSQEDREQDRFHGRSSAGTQARIKLSFVEGAYAIVVGATVGIGSGVVLYVGTHRVQQGAITLGELLLVMGYLTQLYSPIKMMARKAGSLQDHLASAERAFGLLDEAPDVPQRPNARPLDRSSGKVDFRAVSFAYEPDRLALADISFVAEPGMRVGIAGVTGAGKTTLMNLLMRFYDPTAGRIELDGVDLRDYKLSDLRNQFGVVLQEPVLFSTSIAENISYARPDASRQEVEAAATAANIHDLIVSLPDGYDTPVGERGMRLSGGERQRLSLARAFLKGAPILILDEPTSSVDVKTETRIMEAMERLMVGRTSFMIAHRLGTLEGCDLRLELDGGRLTTGTSHRPELRTTAPPVRSPKRRTASPATVGNGRAPRRTSSGSGELLDHPAVKAWMSLTGSKPRSARVVKRGKRPRKRVTYVLEGAGPGGSPVIAKLCRRKTAEIESAVYEQVLPDLPMSGLAYYGSVPDTDREYSWLFLEDAGGELYSPADPEHRRLAARWLAGAQIWAGQAMRGADLPDRGPRHYLVHVLQAHEEIVRQLRRRDVDPEGRTIMGELVVKLETLEGRWHEVAAYCDALPQTVVHGDLVPKNLRITNSKPTIGLAVFDWEMAGIGTQAPDLAQLLGPERSELEQESRSKRFYRFSANPCLRTYRSILRASGIRVDTETVESSAAIGNVLRCVAGLNWTCSQATSTWCPIDDFAVLAEWLGDAMMQAGLSSRPLPRRFRKNRSKVAAASKTAAR
jgi:ABC-type transport system involved in Fe-S cluster assembly fused permease/ATPase subunit